MSKYIYGLHDVGGEYLMLDDGVTGTVVDAVAIGADPNQPGGRDYSHLAGQGLEVLVRFQYGWGEMGCIPLPHLYGDFARRCANFVQDSFGCHTWTVGNEMNATSLEGPADSLGERQPIPVDSYVDCFVLCRDAIHGVTGHGEDLVIPGAIGPWNIETGDPLDYFELMLWMIHERGGCGGIALHAYSHGTDPALVASEEQRHGWHWHFRTYRDFLERIPEGMRDLSVWIAEADQNEPWVANGWIEEAYKEIDRWNKTDRGTLSPVHALCLYRWGKHDQYAIDGHGDVQDEFVRACRLGFTWGDGGNDMWREVFRQDCEGGLFPVQSGSDGHLEVVEGFACHYRHTSSPGDFPRPELKPKDKENGQPEVFEGRYAQSGFYISSTGQFALVSDRIYVEPGRPVRGSAMYMHVFGDRGGGGSRCGIVDGDGPFIAGAGPEWPKDGLDPFSDPSISWGKWESTYGGLSNRRWVKLLSPEVVPVNSFVRLIVRFNADTAASGSNGHWDLFVVEQDTDVPVPPGPSPPDPPGSGPYVVETYVDGQLVASGEFEVQVESLRIVPTGRGARVLGASRESLGDRLQRVWRVLWKRP